MLSQAKVQRAGQLPLCQAIANVEAPASTELNIANNISELIGEDLFGFDF